MIEINCFCDINVYIDNQPCKTRRLQPILQHQTVKCKLIQHTKKNNQTNFFR